MIFFNLAENPRYVEIPPVSRHGRAHSAQRGYDRTLSPLKLAFGALHLALAQHRIGQVLIGTDALSLAMAVDAVIDPGDLLLFEDALPTTGSW